MTQAQGQSAAREDATLSFKRYILEESSGFEAEPMADLYRVNLLGQMLDRYDELHERGMGETNCVERVKYEFSSIPRWMREEGFTETADIGAQQSVSRWPQLTEDEAAQYIKESNEYLHKQTLGVALCTACVAPMMIMCGVGELVWELEDFSVMFGLVGMFGMIGMGVYTMMTAMKPKNHERIKKGRFSLSARLRKKLTQLSELTAPKVRKRKAKGITMLVLCMVPLFMGTMLEEMWYSDVWPLFGLAGMFAMIGAGVYEVVMGRDEEKTLKRLLETKDEKR
ncbi:MAG: hypothetical protein Q4F18_06910 [Clostridia bacterium]|nr:hypothetical protein [Clostridia bacterium]